MNQRRTGRSPSRWRPANPAPDLQQTRHNVTDLNREAKPTMVHEERDMGHPHDDDNSLRDLTMQQLNIIDIEIIAQLDAYQSDDVIIEIQ